MKATINRDLTMEIRAKAEEDRLRSINQSVDMLTADLKKAADDMAAVLKMLTR